MTNLYINNAQYIVCGPVCDGLKWSQDPKQYQYISDLTITASLYSGRNINDPVTTPGTLVTTFGTSGSIVLPYTANGIYQVLLPAFTVSTGGYVLVFDAPASVSGYQFHVEQLVNVLPRNQ